MNLEIFKKIFKNKIFHFFLNRYFVFFIQFINFSFISIKLGVYYFGVWSFILLFLQYATYSTLGTEYSLNILLSTKKRSDSFNSIIYSNGVLVLFSISIITLFLCFSIVFFDISLFSKYSFKQYFIPAILITILWNFNNYYSNLYRVYGKLFEIAFFQTAIQVFLLPAIFIFPSKELIHNLVYFTVVAHFLSLLLFIKNSPLAFKLRYNRKISQTIIKRGLFLLFFNVSAYMILISSKTIVSIFYTVEDMGQFSFANSISQTAIMGFSVISFILFPKLIEKFNLKDKNHLNAFKRAKEIYFYAAYFTILLVILFLPFLLYFFEQYKESQSTIVFMLLAQILAATSFAHSIQLISNKKELKLGLMAFTSVIINIVICLLLKNIFNLGYEYIAFGNIITALIYSGLTIYIAKEFEPNNKFCYFKEIKLQLIIFLPFVISLINTLLLNNYFINLMSIFLLVALNFQRFRNIYKDSLHLVTDFKI